MKILRKRNSTAEQEQSVQQLHVDEARLPIDPKTKKPIPPRAQPGYYPGFSTLSQQAFWDEATRNVVMRLEGGKPEPWEVDEQRYEWEPPASSLSGTYTPVGGLRGHKQQTPGQEGTH
jgi:hypothetical protein